jgi:hypothetical protein
VPYVFHRPRSDSPVSVAPMTGNGVSGMSVSGAF